MQLFVITQDDSRPNHLEALENTFLSPNNTNFLQYTEMEILGTEHTQIKFFEGG